MSARNGRAFLFVLIIFVLSVAARKRCAADKTSLAPSRESITRIVTQIQRADYEGDRPALKRLHDELTPIPEGNKLASQVLYWRGFALWRRAINGFNETPTPNDLEADLTQAVTDFKDAIARDPAFVESKIAAVSSLGYLMYLNKKDPTRVQELFQQSSPLLKEAMAAAPDNPRLLWVLGPIRWSSPPERGGGQDKAFEGYNRGLEAIRSQKRDASDPLEPSWGEPELLMSLAWSNLNRTTPDLNAAEQDAQDALKIVPYWHYVRDILMPQIQAAQAKALPAGAGSALRQTQNQPNAKIAQYFFVRELRGVAIFRVGAEQTAKLTQDDPIVKAGLLKTEIHPWGPRRMVNASTPDEMSMRRRHTSLGRWSKRLRSDQPDACSARV